MSHTNGSRPGVLPGALALALAMTMASGCAVQGEMTNLWHDPDMGFGSVHKVLVIAMRKDPVRRRMWEDAFVGSLEQHGLTATASYTAFDAAPPDTQQVIDLVNRDGYDAVLTTTRLADEQTSRRMAGEYRQQQVFAQDVRGYGRFHSYWVSIQDPGYDETDTIIRVQTDLWAASNGGGRLVWSGTLRTLESVAGRTVKQAVDDAIVPQLVAQGLVPHKSK